MKVSLKVCMKLETHFKASDSTPGLELRHEPLVLRPTRNNPKHTTLQSNNFQNTECTMSQESWDQADTPEKPTTVSVPPTDVRYKCVALATEVASWRVKVSHPGIGRCPS